MAASAPSVVGAHRPNIDFEVSIPMLKAATAPIQEPHRPARTGSASMFDGDLWDDHPPGPLWQARNRLAGLAPKQAQRSRR
jgi:hypothetical protein